MRFNFWIWFFTALLTVIVFYSLIGVEMQFLRAESGQYLVMALGPAEQRLEFISKIVSQPSNGHYTPLAFTSEIIFSKLFGGNGTAWFLRQAVLAALLGGSIAWMVWEALTPSKARAYIVAGAVSFIILSVTFVDVFSWPFMGLQFMCCALACLACMKCIQLSRTLQNRDAWWAVLLGYASMHFFGAGLAISLTTLLCVCLICFTSQKWFWKPIVVGGILTLAHGAFMLTSAGGAEGTIQWWPSFLKLLAMLAYMPSQSIRYAVDPGTLPWPNLSTDVVLLWGLVAVIIIAGMLVRAVWLIKKERNAEAVAVLFPLILFLLMTAMICYRLRAETAIEAILPFTFGGRYLIFTILSLAMLFGALPSKKVVAFVATALGLWIGVISINWWVHTAPSIWPNHSLSHSAVWIRLQSTTDEKIDLLRYTGEFPTSACAFRTGDYLCNDDKLEK